LDNADALFFRLSTRDRHALMQARLPAGFFCFAEPIRLTADTSQRRPDP
jgi:hypothetical protein